MNKRLIIIVLCGLLSLAFASCSHPSIIGTWVEPAIEGSLYGEEGFTLLENGKIEDYNSSGFREFKSWEKNGNKLIIKGVINGSNPEEFEETYDIVTLDDEQLVLVDQSGYSVTYQRK